MLRRMKFAVVAAAIMVTAMAITATYIWTVRHRGPASDEFFVYATFLSRLSKDEALPLDRFALADTSFQLLAATGEDWIPAELRPYPPDEAEASERFIGFCGAWCGREFMTKNLRAWQLKPTSAMKFRFDIVPTSSEPSPREGEERVVTVTRPGFDLWHHRAVFSYSFDCGSGETPSKDAMTCVQFGQVFMERIKEEWRVTSYSASTV